MSKKWTLLLLPAVICSLMVFGSIMFVLDPVLNYGTERQITPYYEYSTLYTNPGIAKHYTYDTVMVGTSMIQNTSVDLCEELLECSMVRLPYSGGTSYDMKTILDICFGSENHIKTVYWELDQFQLFSHAAEHRYPVPEYLYNYSVKDDLSYLLNLDIMYHYGMNNVLGSLQGKSSPAERRGITWKGNFSKEGMMEAYTRPEISQDIRVFEGSELQGEVDANLGNMTALIEAHPDTEFVFFVPPFSILYWDGEVRAGSFESVMDGTQYAIDHLLSYENVRLYYYQSEESIIANLDNYKDHSHYGNWINDTVTRFIAEDHGRVYPDTIHGTISRMKELVYHYDFESLFG